MAFKNKSKKIMNLNKRCAPSKTDTTHSCFSFKDLIRIAKKYNEDDNNKNKININNISKKEIVKELEKRITNCDNHACWLNTYLVKSLNDDNINKNTFRPEGPVKKNEWLNTTHINEVLKQYTYVYPEFTFLGTVPYDFEELDVLGFNKIDFNEYFKQKKTKFGMVINLDEHNQSGSHWVALYFDLLKNQIYFFDSVGKKPGIKIKRFINKITNFLYEKEYKEKIDTSEIMHLIKKNTESSKKYTLLLKKFDINYNNIQHQFKNSECGVYSMNFIIRLLKGETFEYITKNITLDDDINKCREKYFNNVIIE